MAPETLTGGELIYDVTLQFTGITEYGFSMETLMTGQEPLPPQGARFDVAFAGTSSGPKIKGTTSGVDYINFRADGRSQLHIHAEITDDKGEKISYLAEGTSTPTETPGVFNIHENVTLSSASPAYSWVNALHIWAVGTVNTNSGEIKAKGYMAQAS